MEIETLPLENASIPEETTAESTDGEFSEEAAGAPEAAEEAADQEAEEIDFSALAKKDLSALCAAFPELSGMGSLAELPEPERYGELREAGLSPIEAFCASHHKLLIPHRTDNRAHLSPSIGRAASPGSGRISASALSEARDLFPSLSDREIEALYHRVHAAR